jgi:hypothetical protein
MSFFVRIAFGKPVLLLKQRKRGVASEVQNVAFPK